jgi:hypothetical protein
VAQRHAQYFERAGLRVQGAELSVRLRHPWRRASRAKYRLTKIAGGNIRSNSFIVVPAAASHDPADFQSPEGAFSPKGNNIAVLQRRGVVFLACHNAIWELAERLIAADQNPDRLAIDALAAELTNHLIPGAILTPGVVPTMVKLQIAGFVYTR